jgi:WD40 repeat protein
MYWSKGSRILTVATGAVLTWTALDVQGGASRKDLYGDELPAGAIARLGTVRFRHGGELNWLAFAPDGKSLWGGGGDIYVWDPATGRRLRRMRITLPSDTLAISADRRALAVWLPDARIHLYDLVSGTSLGTLPGSKLQPGSCLPGQCLAL